MKAKLIHKTPLWVAEYTARFSHNSQDKTGKNDKDSAEWIRKIGHDAILKHIDLHFELEMPRSILLEFEKHIIGVCTPDDVMSDINRSTRYTLNKLIDILKSGNNNLYNFVKENTSYRSSFVLTKALIDCDVIKLYKAYNDGNTTPDKLKLFLPEAWINKGVFKISMLAFKNIVNQRYLGETGKPHFLIKELVGLMINELDDSYKSLIGLENAN